MVPMFPQGRLTMYFTVAHLGLGPRITSVNLELGPRTGSHGGLEGGFLPLRP